MEQTAAAGRQSGATKNRLIDREGCAPKRAGFLLAVGHGLHPDTINPLA